VRIQALRPRQALRDCLAVGTAGGDTGGDLHAFSTGRRADPAFTGPWREVSAGPTGCIRRRRQPATTGGTR
jgi:hypothetical protein